MIRKKSFENRTTAKEDCGRGGVRGERNVTCNVTCTIYTGDGSNPSGSNPDIIISSR